ncbi:restriction endonuclease subunit S [Agromyces sp. PvR057]|uniref:restriction endonuclease subunit S n=1 Tax=Agromyces sp. PvR057 TaxID=3156403 RepID=UPI0033946D86
MSGFPRRQLKRVATVTLGKMLQPNQAGHSDVELEYLRAAHIQPRGRLIDLDSQKMWFTSAEQRQLTLQAGDVVVVEGGAGYGRSALLAEDRAGWAFQNSVVRVRPSADRSNGAFLNYAIQESLTSGGIDVAINTATIPHFTAEKIARHEIPLPDVEAQQQIAEYLDRETAEIDAFIADQQELITLLTERRAATISHVAAARPGWRTTAIKHVADMLPGFAFKSDEFRGDEAGTRLMRGINVSVGTIDWSEVASVDNPIGVDRYVLREGDLVLGMDRPFISRGTRVAQIRDADAGSLLVQRVLRVRGTAVATRLLYYALSSQEFNDYMAPEFTGVSVPHMSEFQVGEFRIAVPRPTEQGEIVAHLDRETSEIDAAIADAREAIALSKERRAALISAAVTGRLDTPV